MFKQLYFYALIILIPFFITNCSKAKDMQSDNNQPKTEIKKEEPKTENKASTQTDKMTGNPRYIISVTQAGKKMGDIEIELFPEVAPKHCRNFDSLVAIKFYDGTAFHRVIPNFMIQGGDPNTKNKPKNTWGTGDPTQKTVPAEFSAMSHVRGTISAARTPDPNSATSQFFICVVPTPHLNGQYSIFGKVVTGMDVADKIVSVPTDNNPPNCPKDKVEMTIRKK